MRQHIPKTIPEFVFYWPSTAVHGTPCKCGLYVQWDSVGRKLKFSLESVSIISDWSSSPSVGSNLPWMCKGLGILPQSLWILHASVVSARHSFLGVCNLHCPFQFSPSWSSKIPHPCVGEWSNFRAQGMVQSIMLKSQDSRHLKLWTNASNIRKQRMITSVLSFTPPTPFHSSGLKARKWHCSFSMWTFPN